MRNAKYHRIVSLHVFSFPLSGKLNVSSDTVQHGVEGLIYLLTESSKLMVRTCVDCVTWPGSLSEFQGILHASPASAGCCTHVADRLQWDCEDSPKC